MGITKREPYLPIPLLLVSERDDEVSDEHDNHVRNHGRQSHFRFSDPTILPGRACSEPIREHTVRAETDDCADEHGEVHEPNTLAREIIRRVGEDLRLRQVQGEEAAGRPRHDEGGEFDSGECE